MGSLTTFLSTGSAARNRSLASASGSRAPGSPWSGMAVPSAVPPGEPLSGRAWPGKPPPGKPWCSLVDARPMSPPACSSQSEDTCAERSVTPALHKR